MTDVFLLGAGFSKAISEEMPLLSELSAQVRERGLDFPTRISTLGDNLEIWLSYLSQPHPWLRESDALKNRAAALDITEKLSEVLSEKEQLAVESECPAWLKTLTQTWHDNKAGVISLNYDTLVERAAGTVNLGKDDHLSADQLYPVILTLSSRRDGVVFGSNQVDTFKLFKLHGSINWYYSGASEYTGEVIYYTHVVDWDHHAIEERVSKASVADKVPLIVPPTTEKSLFFKHESLKQMWSQALLALLEADRLFVVGYSLPATDLAIRLFLHEGSKGIEPEKELYVVNSDPLVLERYRELLGQAYVIRDDFVGEGAIDRLITKGFGPASLN